MELFHLIPFRFPFHLPVFYLIIKMKFYVLLALLATSSAIRLMGPAKEEAAEAAATEAPPAPASCYPECSGGGYD